MLGLVACGGTTTEAPATSAPATTALTSATAAVPLDPVAPAIVADVAYAPVSSAQRLDVYLPSAGTAPYPLVVLIHGGAWMTGDKRGELEIAAIPGFLALGYAVASVNYRLSGEATFPAPLLDVKAAVRFLRAHAAEYRLDPDRFAAIGESAGAHLAALLGTSAGVADLDDPSLGNPDESSAVQAVVDFYGPVDFLTSESQLHANPVCAGQVRPTGQVDPAITQLLGAPPESVPGLAAAANPITYLHDGQDVPLFFIAHGDTDCVVPYQQSVQLHDAIEAIDPGRSQLSIVPGSGHYTAFDFNSQSAALAAFLAAAIGSSSG